MATDWERQEKILAHRIRGKRSRGSGNRNQKGDVFTRHWLIECKSSSHPSRITIYLKWLEKVRQEARASGKMPALYLKTEQLACVLVPYEFQQQQEDPGWRSRVMDLKNMKHPTTIHSSDVVWITMHHVDFENLILEEEEEN